MPVAFLDIQIQSHIVPQKFICLVAKETASPVVVEDIIIKNTAALIGTSDQQRNIVKLIEPRKWHEIAKMFWNRSRVHKEVRGNRLLKAIGVRVPCIHVYGIAYLPSFDYRYIGFIQMDNLIYQGAQDASHLLYWDNKLPVDIRERVYGNIIADLKKMRAHRIVFSDLTLGNIMVYADGTIAWIDTGVTQYSVFNTSAFTKKFAYSINRFLDIHRNVLTESEFSLFQPLIC